MDLSELTPEQKEAVKDIELLKASMNDVSEELLELIEMAAEKYDVFKEVDNMDERYVWFNPEDSLLFEYDRPPIIDFVKGLCSEFLEKARGKDGKKFSGCPLCEA